MARIRSVKPEFFRSEELAPLSRDARLAFIGLWTIADDEGYYAYHPKILAADLYPLDDDVSAADVEKWIQELVDAGEVCLFEVAGKRFLHVVRWAEYQKVDHKGRRATPDCPKPHHRGSDEPSPDPREPSDNPYDPSPNPPESPDDPREPSRDSREPSRLDLGSGITDQGSENPVVEQARPADPDPIGSEQVEQVFAAWQQSTGKHRAVLDPKRQRLIRGALKSHGLEVTLLAVRGWENSPHHRGENERGTVYNDLELLLRDAKHIEQFAGYARGEGLRTPAARRRAAANGEEGANPRDLLAAAERMRQPSGIGR